MRSDDTHDIDREIRINELKHEAEELAGGAMTTWEAEDAPQGLIESFWETVVAYEKAPWTSDYQQLLEAGMELPPPEELSEEQLTACLWELIRRLASHRSFLSNTDHLSDRELYTELWTETLHERKADVPVGMNGAYHIDMVGSGSDEDTQLYLKYYADDRWIEDWRTSWPNDPIPAREKPKYDRDRHLPQAEYS
ncbi:MAG: hypothetical protein KF873_20850 [Gemmataceae bacterium]|jgi:hypothetical protein|nr:hypothetical protein [Gemmataceae bacterium]